MPQKKSRKGLIIFFVVLAVLVLLVLFIRSRIKKAADTLLAQLSAVETAQVERRTLASTVSASGKVVARDEKQVTSSLTGQEVTAVWVAVGDTVRAGDILCTFRSKSYEQQVSAAEHTQAENSLKNDHSIQAEEQALRDAQADYDREVSNLQGEVDRCLHEWEVAHQNLIQAQADLTQAQADQKTAEEIEEARQKLLSAETAANSAYASYDSAIDNQTSQLVSLSEAIETARYNLELAKMEKAGDTSSQSVSDAREEVEKTIVTAPISGLITSVSVSTGDALAGTEVATIEDCSSYVVSAKIDEYDISKIQVGQETVIRTNGTDDREFSGKVLEISPHALAQTATSSGDVQYEVRISIDGDLTGLKLDMTAKLSIILEQRDDVLTVPYEAVQEDEDGSFYVEVPLETADAEDTDRSQDFSPPETRRVPVEKGIESDYYVEVSSPELSEGMEVVVPHSDADGSDIAAMLQARGPMGGM